VKSAVRLSRRSLLGLAALTLAGCKTRSAASSQPADPDAAALRAARASEQMLLGSYDAAIASARGAAAVRLRTERALHAQHLAALGGGPPIRPPTAGPPAEPGPALRRTAATFRAFAVAAVRGGNAALLASIAASHEAMAHE
jgi:hypothetical protein